MSDTNILETLGTRYTHVEQSLALAKEQRTALQSTYAETEASAMRKAAALSSVKSREVALQRAAVGYELSVQACLLYTSDAADE